MTRQQFSRQNIPPGFYTYAYLRAEDSDNGPKGSPYYIGKGQDKRAWERHGSEGKYWMPPANEQILILKWNISENNAFAHEIYLIAVYGNIFANGLLTKNFTDGGEGSSGYEWQGTDEEIQARVDACCEGKYRIGASRAQMNLRDWMGLTRKERTAFHGWSQKNPTSSYKEFKVYKEEGGSVGNICRRFKIKIDHYLSLTEIQRRALKAWFKGSPERTGEQYFEMVQKGVDIVSQNAADKYGIKLNIWITLTRQQIKNIAKRYARGRRGEELLIGIAA